MICECSSFQLEDAEAFAPECAVLLNLSPDHLDRHGTIERYLEAKLRVFANQGNDDFAVFNGCEPILRGRDLGGCARRIAFCRGCDGDDCEVVLDGEHDRRRRRALVERPTSCACSARTTPRTRWPRPRPRWPWACDRDAWPSGLRAFGGVAHRLELVGELGGVRYVNDSKATNVAAARGRAALVRGRRARDPRRQLQGRALPRAGRGAWPSAARACYLIGETAPALERDLRTPGRRACRDGRFDAMAAAFAAAASAARAGDVVLLAPACASFDAYRDYAERGDDFRRLYAGLGPRPAN